MIGKILSDLISNKGITPYELSKKTGISESTLSRILNKDSKPNIKNRKILADYFNIDEQYLINGKQNKTALTKNGVTFTVQEISLFVVNNFNEFLEETIFSNAIEVKAQNRIIEIMESKIKQK